MMERDVYEVLERWAAAERRLPLVLCGARQVGKTYALQELGRRSFSSCAYLNFMDEGAQAVLEGGYDARRALDNIGIYTHTKIIPGQTLVVLDEVQEAPAVLPLMKAFAEDAPEYHVAAAGSYLGIAYHAGESFPVGKVQMVDMHPACFLEFLGAVGEGELARLVRSLDFGRLAPFEDRLRRLLREYLYVGGMPQVIVAFMDGDRDYQAARAIQSALLQQYDRDFSKHPAPHGVERIRLAFDSIPAHLGRENHKFVFGHIARGARARVRDGHPMDRRFRPRHARVPGGQARQAPQVLSRPVGVQAHLPRLRCREPRLGARKRRDCPPRLLVGHELRLLHALRQEEKHRRP